MASGNLFDLNWPLLRTEEREEAGDGAGSAASNLFDRGRPPLLRKERAEAGGSAARNLFHGPWKI